MADSLQRDRVEIEEPLEQTEHQAPEITYDEQFYPARPKRFEVKTERVTYNGKLYNVYPDRK